MPIGAVYFSQYNRLFVYLSQCSLTICPSTVAYISHIYSHEVFFPHIRIAFTTSSLPISYPLVYAWTEGDANTTCWGQNFRLKSDVSMNNSRSHKIFYVCHNYFKKTENLMSKWTIGYIIIYVSSYAIIILINI